MTDGAYRVGDGLLHRMSPGIKVAFLIVLIACLFSSVGFQRPLLAAALWGVLACSVEGGFRDLWRVVRLLRWLFLFTLVLHLLFSPGKTLFGVPWLSYDGLIRGLLINLQLTLAVGYSLLLSWTTLPTQLASGLGALLSPLKVVGLPVREVSHLFLLVLFFLPLVKADVTAQLKEEASTQESSPLKRWVRLLETLMARLFDRADQLAHDLSHGKVFDIDNEHTVVSLSKTATAVVVLSGVLFFTLMWQV